MSRCNCKIMQKVHKYYSTVCIWDTSNTSYEISYGKRKESVILFQKK